MNSQVNGTGAYRLFFSVTCDCYARFSMLQPNMDGM
jgi:hypothetical protein